MATVEELQRDIEDLVQELTDKADASAEALKSAADAIRDEFIDFDTTRFSVSPASDVDGPNALDGIEELQNLVINLNPDDLLNGDFTRHVYDSAFFDYLEPKLIEFIENAQTGIDEDVQDALFENMYERDLQTLNDAIDEVERVDGARGFPIPTSMMMAARNEIISKYQEQLDNRNREVTALIAERAQQNVHHSIDAGIRMEDIQSRFTLTFAEHWFRFGDLLIAQYKAQVDAAVARIRASVDYENLDMQAKMASSDADKTNKDRYIREWQIKTQNEIQETSAEIQQALERAKTQLAGYNNVMEYYTSAVAGGLSSISGLTIKQE